MENGQNDRVDGRGTKASPVDAVDDSAAGQNQTDMNALPGSETLKSQENRHGLPDVEVKGLKWSVHIPELTRREIDLPSHCLLRPYEQPWTGEGQRRIDLAERLAFVHGRSCLRRRAGVDRNPSRRAAVALRRHTPLTILGLASRMGSVMAANCREPITRTCWHLPITFDRDRILGAYAITSLLEAGRKRRWETRPQSRPSPGGT